MSLQGELASERGHRATLAHVGSIHLSGRTIRSACTAAGSPRSRPASRSGASGHCRPTSGRLRRARAAPTDRREIADARSELVRAGPTDAITVNVDPAFASDWSDVDVAMPLWHGNQAIWLVRDGSAMAYPLKFMRWHEWLTIP